MRAVPAAATLNRQRPDSQHLKKSATQCPGEFLHGMAGLRCAGIGSPRINPVRNTSVTAVCFLNAKKTFTSGFAGDEWYNRRLKK